MVEHKNCYYLEFIKEITPGDLLPGARELLEEIHAAELKSAIGYAGKNASEVIEQLGIADLLDVIADGHSVERQKPAPDLFLHAAGLLQLSPSECVMVEDAAAGIEAARASGFRSIGLGPTERVGMADLVLPDLRNAHLKDLLSALDKNP
ncbi:MAG TPA: HAD-IA family hydrolase [Anaerolineales bacterium]|nr:HAD-IA family hydrolase [Anaerolineales bacterium]